MAAAWSWLAPWCAGNSRSKMAGCFTPKTPNTWAEPLHTTLQETAACRIGAVETLMGTLSTTIKHRARQAQPSTPGVNCETQEPGWTQMPGWW